MRVQRMDEPEEPLWVGLKCTDAPKDLGSHLQILVLYVASAACHGIELTTLDQTFEQIR